ncbi:MAG TPA: glycosyltransferase [Tepidisphaeraceae bacterium]|jgi:hypothetical protein|nr:glycosyltransferase [Tepidisphaeraceae bacterium]
MNGLADFLARRKSFTNEYFACPGSTKTVLISSYIWWTELIAYALLRLGYNVLVAEPWYLMWIDDQRFANFDSIYRQWVDVIKRMNVQLVIGGNSTIAVPHPVSKELLHRAAGVPAISYWWDEPRNTPPMVKRGLTLDDHLTAMKDDRTLNVFWDIDIAEEMQQLYGVDGVHVPLGATPEFWQTENRPLADRPTKLCFLGNNHDEGGWAETCDSKLMQWAQAVVKLKLANLDRGMLQCVQEVGTPGSTESKAHSVRERGSTPGNYQVSPDTKDEFYRWMILGGVLLTECRNRIVKAAGDHLGDEFLLIGKRWDRLGLKARQEHSGVPAAKEYYASSKASLNLFGGCVHGGMPLRPYEIAASNGLVFTQYNRELPGLFEPGRECVAFREAGEMVEALDRILAAPAEFDRVVDAGRKRAVAEHTWEKRMERVLEHAKEKFGLPW